MHEALNRASSQDFKTSGFPLNPERFRDGNEGDVVTVMRPLITRFRSFSDGLIAFSAST
jgi:hypothetical protein